EDEGAAVTPVPRLAEEVRLVSIVLCGPGGPHATDDAVDVAAAIQPARVEILADDALLVLLAGAEATTDQAARAARLAVAAGRLLPGRGIAIATGRAQVGGAGRPPRLPVGDLIDKAARALARAPAGAISVDEGTAGLLDAHFEVQGIAGTLLLVGERTEEAT